MDVRLRKYGSRAVRVWGYIGITIIAIAILWAIGRLGDAISVLFIGALMAFIYAPIVNWLDRRLHVPRILGTFIGMLVLFAVVVLLIFAILPPIVDQTMALLSAVPGYVEMIQESWNDIVAFIGSVDAQTQGAVSDLFNDLTSRAEQLASVIASAVGNTVVPTVFGAVTGVVNVFMALVISFWLAKDFPRMEREIATIVGPRIGDDYRIVTSVFGRSLGGYLKGLLLTSSCTGLIAGLGYWMLGIPYSGLLGLITGILNVIPYIGPWVGGALAFFVGLTVSPLHAFLSIVVSFCAQQLTDMFVSPKVMQSAVSLHPVLVIVALLGGGAIGGVGGMIMAVPLTAAAKGVFVYYFEKRTGRQLVRKEGALFRGEPFNDESGNPRPACDALGVDIAGDKGVPPRIKRERDERLRAAVEASATHAEEGEDVPSNG